MKIIMVICISLLLSSCNNKSLMPDNFDSRELKRVSSYKAQSWGTCWAFATISSIESNLMANRAWENEGEKGEANLSEYHLDKYNGFNRDGRVGDKQNGWYSGQGEGFKGSNYDNYKDGLVVHLGGDYQVATAYLARMGGAVQERLTPEVLTSRDYEQFGYTDKDGVKLKNNYSHFLPHSIEWLTFSGSTIEKRNAIKKSIMKYGAVASSQNMRDEPLAIAKNGLEIHMNTHDKKLNHAISLIGWDDRVQYREHRGAWLVKDSDHKDEKTGKHIGVFYIMYDDLHTAKDEMMGGISFSGSRKTNFKNVYTYSLHGWRYKTNDNIESIKTIFRIEEDSILDSLGYISIGKNNEVYLSIIRNGEEITTLSKSHLNTGFYVTKFDKSFEVEKNDIVEVVQRNTSKTFGFEGSFMMEVLLGGSLPKWGEPVSVSSRAFSGEAFYQKSNESKFKDFSLYAEKDWVADPLILSKVGKSSSPTIYLYVR